MNLKVTQSGQLRNLGLIKHIREGYRKSVCGVDIIYYRVNDDAVEIMSILGRQDREKWLR